MSDRRITIRISAPIQKKMAALIKQSGRTESDIVRNALETYFEQQAPVKTAYDAFLESGLIGDAPELPSDLATNPKYMEGFGRD